MPKRSGHAASPLDRSRPPFTLALSTLLLASLAAAHLDAQSGGPERPPENGSEAGGSASSKLPPQTVLSPGLYLFQTRTREGSCNDAPRTGYVTSAVATLDGVPGSRTMTMQLLNSKWWPSWSLNVGADNTITGSANWQGGKDAQNGSSRFEIRAKKERFQGTGTREYLSKANGQTTRCTLHYDALLKALD